MTARAGDDPEIFRAVMRREMQLDPVAALAADTALLDRAQALATDTDHEAAPTRELARETVLELIAKVGPRPTST